MLRVLPEATNRNRAPLLFNVFKCESVKRLHSVWNTPRCNSVVTPSVHSISIMSTAISRVKVPDGALCIVSSCFS